MSYLLAAAAIAGAAGTIPLLHHHRRRTRVYGELARSRAAIVAAHPPCIATAADLVALRATFEQERMVRIPAFIAGETLEKLQAECSANAERAERSHLPGHKKGGTLSYEAIHCHAPACLALYHSEALLGWLSALTGEALRVTADHDQSSCSLLYYDRAGDHIGWHYDHNFYRGRHFTVLLSLCNRAVAGGLSAGRLQRRRQGLVTEVETAENTLVVFEGARVFHRSTAVGDGDELVRRIKDTAYYGPRVLFD